VIGAELRMLQGRRRLELFGEDHNIRPGWVTVGNSLVGSNFSAQVSFCSIPFAPGTLADYVDAALRSQVTVMADVCSTSSASGASLSLRSDCASYCAVYDSHSQPDIPVSRCMSTGSMLLGPLEGLMAQALAGTHIISKERQSHLDSSRSSNFRLMPCTCMHFLVQSRWPYMSSAGHIS